MANKEIRDILLDQSKKLGIEVMDLAGQYLIKTANRLRKDEKNIIPEQNVVAD